MRADPVFVDTNLFLRYLTNDIPAQAEAVEGLLRQAGEGKLTLVTNAMVMAELVWVMESFYRLPRTEILGNILAIASTPGLQVAEADAVVQAVVWYAEKNVDFVDAFNAAWALQEGIQAIYTFDQRHFARLEGLSVRVPGAE